MQARTHLPLAVSLLGCLGLGVSALALAQGGASQSYFPTLINKVDAPSAGTGPLQGTAAKGIDATGDAAGSYVDANGTSHGFVFLATGMTTFDVPGAGTGKNQGTFVTAMDAAGDVAGYYTTAGGLRGFVRAANGAITTFTVSTGGWPGEGTEVLGINSSGAVTGEDQVYDEAFVGSPGGPFTSFSVPEPGTSFGYATAGIAINSAGVIAGRYIDYNGISHGFVRAVNGTITTFDPPGVATKATLYGDSGTIPTSIDTAGDIAGTYTDTAGARHSFVRIATGAITSFDPPGTNANPCATTGAGALLCGSGALGMDDAMDIVGAYFDTNNVASAYLRYGANGNFATVTPSEAGTSALQGSGFFAINATGAIAGTYVDSSSVLHGFTYNLPVIQTTTTLSPAPTPNPSTYGQLLTVNATVTSGNGTIPNDGEVYFIFNSISDGTATLSNGAASTAIACTPAGTWTVSANYGGDSTYLVSSSPAINLVVNPASTTTSLSSSSNPSLSGQAVTLTATVSEQSNCTPSGSVTFSSGGTSLGSVTLSGSNAAKLTTSALPLGTNSITAVYSGDFGYAGSTSASLSQVVVAPDFSVAATPASQTVTAGQNGTASVSVTPANGFNSAVSFTCSGLPSGASCSFLPQTVTPSGAVASTTLTVTTTPSMAAIHRQANPLFPITAIAALVCCFGWKKRRLLQLLSLIVIGVVGFGLLSGCGGGNSAGGSSGQQSATYSITVIATSGSLAHSTSFSLTVD